MKISVTTQHNDNRRTGTNLNEATLNTANVKAGKFGKLFERAVDGQIYGQPLYLEGIDMGAHGVRNVVYVATMHNSVYAFDADRGDATAPLWQARLSPSIRLPDAKIGGGANYHDISVEIGVLSTPTISTVHNAIYVVAATKNGATFAHHLHALDLQNGADQFGGPVLISGSVQGTGSGNIGGSIQFASHLQNQRAALLLANDLLHIAFASYGDAGDYHGWVFSYGATDLQQRALFNTTPCGSAGGIWQAGQGPAADDKGHVYLMTGNGTFSITSIADKKTLPESSGGCPALVAASDLLVLAFTGTDQDRRIAIATSTDGQTFSAKTVLTVSSLDGPAMAFEGGRLALAWTGLTPARRLNLSFSSDFVNFADQVTLNQTSPHGPALATGNGALCIAWTGEDQRLNVMSSANWRDFGNHVVLTETSLAGPALTFFEGRFYLSWAGTDGSHTLNFLESVDGVHFTHKVTLGETSDFPPVLAKLDQFLLAWTGRNAAHSLNVLTGATDTFSDRSAFGPALTGFRGKVWIAWAGTDAERRLNVARLSGPLLGDAFVQLRPDLSLADWFSPFNTQQLNDADNDLGSGGPLLLPETQLVLGGGKEGKLYLLDAGNMGHFNAGTDSQIVQSFQSSGLPKNGVQPPPPAPFSNGLHHIHGSPVFWNTPDRGPWVYVWAEADWLRAYRFDGQKFDPNPVDISNVTTPGGSMPGAMLSISSDGSKAGTGILWASHPTSMNANQQVVAGTLRAIDAGNLQDELWNSDQNGGDILGYVSKFSPPTVANGRVYAATFSNVLAVYGLLP
jgi:outer membrane protein assembly factor BamB